ILLMPRRSRDRISMQVLLIQIGVPSWEVMPLRVLRTMLAIFQDPPQRYPPAICPHRKHLHISQEVPLVAQALALHRPSSFFRTSRIRLCHLDKILNYLGFLSMGETLMTF